jgi:hypothetical protein
VAGAGPVKYQRLGWRKIRPGHRVKDPRGTRTVLSADCWGYRLEHAPHSTDPFACYSWVSPWPRVGRLKIVLGFPVCLHKRHDGEWDGEITRVCDAVRVWLMPCGGVRREEHT